MQYVKGSGSRNLLTGPGPYYHHTLWRYTAEPIFRLNENGRPIQTWKGKPGIQVRSKLTIDDIIDYFYSVMGARSPQVRRARLAADRGSVESMLAYATVDQILFAIDILAENHEPGTKLPPIIAASDYMEEAIERLQKAKVVLDPILRPIYEQRKGDGTTERGSAVKQRATPTY